jgi:hypothetical protein
MEKSDIHNMCTLTSVLEDVLEIINSPDTVDRNWYCNFYDYIVEQSQKNSLGVINKKDEHGFYKVTFYSTIPFKQGDVVTRTLRAKQQGIKLERGIVTKVATGIKRTDGSYSQLVTTVDNFNQTQTVDSAWLDLVTDPT